MSVAAAAAFAEQSPSHRQRLALRAVWVGDMTAWAALLAGGIVILATHPVTIQLVLGPVPPLVWVFASFWLAGGAAGLILRGLQLGIAEKPALIAAMTALAMYDAVIVCAMTQHGYTNGAMGLVMCTLSFALMGRRLAALRALGSESDDVRRANRLMRWVAQHRQERTWMP